MLLAITSLGENNATKEMLRTQQLAADRRASYQSQVIGENLYKTNGLRMEVDFLERGRAMKPNIRKLYGAMLKDMKAEEVRYREEKKKSEAEAISTRSKTGQEPRQRSLFRFCRVPLAAIHRHRVDLDPFCLSSAFHFLHRHCSARHALYAERLFFDLHASFFPLSDQMNLRRVFSRFLFA